MTHSVFVVEAPAVLGLAEVFRQRKPKRSHFRQTMVYLPNLLHPSVFNRPSVQLGHGRLHCSVRMAFFSFSLCRNFGFFYFHQKIGITPARDLEWKPTCSTNQEDGLMESPLNLFPSLRKARPTSLLNPLVLSSPGLSSSATVDGNLSSANIQDPATQPGISKKCLS